MKDSAQRPDDARQAFRRETRGALMTQSLGITALLAVVLNTVFLPLDWWAFPDDRALFFGVRGGLFAVLALVHFRTRFTRPNASALTCWLAMGAMLLTMIWADGGVTSKYSTGLVLLFCGLPVLLPLSGIEVAGLVSVLLGAYGLLPLIVDTPVSALDYALHGFFPLAGAVVAVGSAALMDRVRFVDFMRRRELEEARDHLKEMDRAKARFTANVHHELRTPLTLMLAPLEAMRSGDFGEVSALQSETLKSMHANALRLLKLINNLLDLAKVEGRQLQIVRRPTRLGDLVEQLMAGARPLAERKGVALEADIDSLPEVNADPDAMEKVVVNLLGNALKFTDAGGRIEVRGTAEPEGLQLVVADTGVGIPPDQLGRIFDRFAQVDGSSTRRFEGTGIGLSLAKELVELHGGRIWAESEGEGHGSQMHVLIPMGESDQDPGEEVLATSKGEAVALGDSLAALAGELGADAEPASATDAPLLELERNVERAAFQGREDLGVEAAAQVPPDAPEVLVVEDNADMRRLLTFLIGQEFRLRSARNGREALEQVRQRKPDLVLTDVMMPEMSGTELCRELKSDPETEAIPVVLVTSKADREMKIEGLELGADDYVTKPFHPRELMARVRGLVRLGALQQELAERNITLESTNLQLEETLEELREAGTQLAQAERLAAVGELAAGIAHEVNNPVNYASNALKALRNDVRDLCGLAERLAELDWDDPEKLAPQSAALAREGEELGLEELAAQLDELVGIATEGLERTGRLVGDLRDFAAPGSRDRTRLDVERGLRSTLQLVGHVLRQGGVEARLEVEPGLPRPLCDARAVNQVFLNLLKNAAEALEGTGGLVRVAARAEGDVIVVEIRDDGPGIAPEVRARLFEPFFTTKPAGQGTGLGLSISKRILDEHGASIEVESEPGEGTAFSLRLPIGEGERAP